MNIVNHIVISLNAGAAAFHLSEGTSWAAGIHVFAVVLCLLTAYGGRQ